MHFQHATDAFTLKNGVKIPCIGFGTWQSADGPTAENAVREAIEAGYRHIDTAAIYHNERSVGRGIKDSGIKREDIFVTSKVWNTCRGYQTTLEAFEKTLSDLQLDYLDLYLIHWPASPSRFANWTELNLETWRALTELYKAGRIRAIGVSNFRPAHLEPLMQTEVQPMVNQIEYHPGYLQREIVDYCRAHEILVEAWSPLGCGRVLTDPRLVALAERLGITTAQLALRFCLETGTLPLPKSVTPERIRANLNVFSFALPRTSLPKSRHSRNSAFPGKIRTKSHSDGSSKKDGLRAKRS